MLAALLELAPGGVEQVDLPGEVEYAVYGAPGELPALPEGEAEVGGVRVIVSGTEVADDWAERWQRFHEPVLVGERLWVRPPWAPPADSPGVIDLVVDPGQAFGTGAHPTTRLSLELLLELEPRGSFADLGCGSGVLAIAAAKLGFGAGHRGGQRAGGGRGHPRERGAKRRDARPRRALGPAPRPPPTADVVAANLTRPLLLEVAQRLSEPPRELIVSGLLEEEADEVGGRVRAAAAPRPPGRQGLGGAGAEPPRPAPLGQHAGDLLPPGAGLGILGAADALAAVAEHLPRAAYRDDPVAGHRVAAVLELDQRAGGAAARAQLARHGRALDLLGRARVAGLLGPGEHAEHRPVGRARR